MRSDDIRLMYEYNYWANKKILSAAANVSQEQYAAAGEYGCLRDTLIHTLDGEVMWRFGFERYVVKNASERKAELDVWNPVNLTEADLSTFSAVEERWQVEEQAMRSYLSTLTDEDMERIMRYAIPGGIVRERVLWHCLLHLVNHGTQHRSEAAVLLTAYGHSPGGVDLTAFLNDYYNLPS